jgi:DNA-binding GntR family transcriptional regulator
MSDPASPPADPRIRAYHGIRRKLLDGTVKTGRDLSRRRLASALDVSPGHVQWALARMEAEGVLESRPQSGTFVRRLKSREFRNLFDIRKLIEPYAAARAAQWITTDELARLESLLTEMASLPDEIAAAPRGKIPPEFVERTVRLEIDFHRMILEAARNPEAARIVENVQILTHLTLYLPVMTRDELIQDARLTLAGHREIVEAVRLGDAKRARRVMRRHLVDGFLPVHKRSPPPE